MEEEEGFEPPRGMTRLSVFKTDPFSQTWVFLRWTSINIACVKIEVNKISTRFQMGKSHLESCYININISGSKIILYLLFLTFQHILVHFRFFWVFNTPTYSDLFCTLTLENSLSFNNNLTISHIWTKDFRNEHGAVLLLIVFQDGCNGSSNR